MSLTQDDIDKLKGDVLTVILDSKVAPVIFPQVDALATAVNLLVADVTPKTIIENYRPPSFHESGFGANSVCGVTARAEQQLKLPYPPIIPGCYLFDPDAPIRWTSINKPDYYDSAGTLYGSVPYAKATVIAKAPHLTEFSVDLDATSLVRDLANWQFDGFALVADNLNSNAIKWRSHLAATNKPILIVDGVTYPCEISAWLSTSSLLTQAGGPQMNTAHNTDFALLRFDLTTLDLTKVQSATLRLWTFDQWGNETIGLYRLHNPQAYLSTVAPIQLGIAAGFPLDVGIENHPSVRFVQSVMDKDYSKLWGATSGTTFGGDSSTFFTPTDLGALGLPPMPGPTGNAIGGVFKVGGLQSTFEAHWSPWRKGQGTTGPWENQLMLKPPSPMEEAYLRYYLMIHGDPLPDGGKLFGFDMRYRDWGTPPTPQSLVGAGRGNSGSYEDPLTGSSARMNHSPEPSASPLKGRIGVGFSDDYVPDQTGPYGPSLTIDRNYLGQLTKDEPHCIEIHLRMNSVTNPTEKQMQIVSLTSLNGVATAVLAQPCTSPLYITGQPMSVGGAGFGSLMYNGEFPITVVSPTVFTYPVPLAAPLAATLGSSPSYPLRWTCCLSTGLFDGVLEAMIDGRFAMGYYDRRFRGSRWLPDGKSIYGIDNFWFPFYQGGPRAPTSNYFMFASGIVVAEQYIGPMVR